MDGDGLEQELRRILDQPLSQPKGKALSPLLGEAGLYDEVRQAAMDEIAQRKATFAEFAEEEVGILEAKVRAIDRIQRLLDDHHLKVDPAVANQEANRLYQRLIRRVINAVDSSDEEEHDARA